MLDNSYGGISEGGMDSSFQESTTEATGNPDAYPRPSPQLASKETKAVRRFRLLMFLVLLVFAIAVSAMVYWYARSVEVNKFEKDFWSNGNQVLDAFREDSYRKLQALFSLSSRMTSHALHSNSSWPFVTLPSSAHEMGPYLSLADAAALTVFPIVPKHLRAEWESYSVQNQHWIDEDLQASNTNTSSLTTAMTELVEATTTGDRQDDYTSISPYIKNYVGVDTSPGVWTPWWQYYPVIPNRWFINFNRLAWKGFQQQLSTLQQGKATLSPTSTFEPGLDFQSTKDFEFFNELLQAGGSGRYHAGEPLSYIFYPIADGFDNDSKTAAILSATVYWKSYFQGILPDNVDGIVCVVSNSAGQAFTYQINGREAVFLGMKDHHNPKFDHLKLSAPYSSFSLSTTQQEPYMRVPIDEEDMAYTLTVYPSQTMQDSFYTANPVYFAIAIALVFVLCAITFLVYNKLVERRQALVFTTAVKSTAVVESIFPSNVRDRLMDDAVANKPQEEHPLQRRANTFTASSNTPASQFLVARSGHNQAAPPSEQQQQPQRTGRLASQPIADYFEDTTVFFADIKGFTKWCESREPVQVFTLLETLYSAFDEIAKRRRVYKVETVGDCYVAVTGLPQKRRDHALVMVRFSKDVLHKFNQTIHELEEELGQGTNRLELRTGIHSGPCTAGVIRGDNARFQLFGDTVNTAARMESTGQGGKVQISQSTADLLKTAGKSRWFHPREEKVFAKGKGELQTFWLNMVGDNAGSTDSHTRMSESMGMSADGLGYSTGGGESGSECGSEGSMVHGNLISLENALSFRIEEKNAPSFEDEPVERAPTPMQTKRLGVVRKTQVEVPMFEDEPVESRRVTRLGVVPKTEVEV